MRRGAVMVRQSRIELETDSLVHFHRNWTCKRVPLTGVSRDYPSWNQTSSNYGAELWHASGHTPPQCESPTVMDASAVAAGRKWVPIRASGL